MKKYLLGLFAVLSLALGVSHAQVQAGLGALSGVVTDATKATIPGATVTLTNPSIGYKKVVTTNGSGEYQFGSLTVVDGYSISVSAKGFSAAVVKNVATSVGTIITQNVSLAIGADTTTVEVEAGNIEQVQTSTSSLSTVVDNAIFENSPLEDRNQNIFLALTPGAAPGYTGRGPAIDGARSGTGNFLIDGYDDDDQGLGGGYNGGSSTTISPDGIQEFRVIATTPPAEYGRAGMFANDIVLKSGTTKFHGSAFEYNRIQALTANNFFSDRASQRDHLVRNQFGGSLGGPVYKDKTFFYATAEFQRLRTGSPSAGVTGTTSDFINFVKTGAFQTFMEGSTLQNPTVTADPANPGNYLTQQGACPVANYQVTGNFSYTCPGALARSATLGPLFAQLFAATPQSFPLATSNFSKQAQGLYTSFDGYTGTNTITTLFPVNVYGQVTVPISNVYNQNRGSLKLDHKLSEKDLLSFTYLADLSNDTNSGGGSDSSPGLPSLNTGGSQLFGATYTRTFGPSLINVFKASYLRHVNNNNVPGPSGVSSTYAADALSTGFGAGEGSLQGFTDGEFVYQDQVTKIAGRHTMKFGYQFIRTRNASYFNLDTAGSNIHWSVEDLLTDAKLDSDLDGQNGPGQPFSYGVGAMYEATASLDLTTGGAPDPYRGYRANEHSAFAQDDFKVSQRLTFNYGIRWDYFSPPHNFRPGIDSNVYFGPNTTPTATGNPYLPQSKLFAGEQGAQFECVNVACGVPSQGKGYAPSSGMSTIWKRDLNNFAPRVGFALDTMGNGKLVIRGGYGIGYDRLLNNVFENIRFNGPHFVDNAFGYAAGNGAITEKIRSAVETVPYTGNSSLAAAGASPTPRHVDQNLQTAYYEQAHLGFETGIKGYVIEVNYVLTLGRQLVGLENANTFEGRTACPIVTKAYAIGSACYNASTTHLGFSTAKATTLFSNDNFRTNGYSSNYNGGQLSVRKGFTNGFQLAANYTYSKGLDQTSDPISVTKAPSTGTSSPYNLSADYGPSDNDFRHLFVMSANYISKSSSHKYLLGGWGLSPIMNIRSGGTVYIYDGASTYSPNKDGLFGVQRAAYLGTGSVKNSINHSVSPAGNGTAGTGFIKANTWGAYVCPATLTYCDVPFQRNNFYGPGLFNLDMQAQKKIPFGERYTFVLQAAFFNVLNHPEFGNPAGNTNSPTTFGESQAAANRVGQLSGRFQF